MLPLLHVSWRGVRVDLEMREQATIDYTIHEGMLVQDLYVAAGRVLDPHSPKQLIEYVYTEHKLKPISRLRKTTVGETKYTTTLDEEAIAELLTRELPTQVREVLRLVLEIRGVHKVLATYLQAPLDKDNRLRCSYAITGAETGRISSRETPLGTGTNLQNVPSGVARAMVVPDDGLVFVSADLSQAEARVVAYLAHETRLIDVFQSGGDVHRRNAAAIFARLEDTVTPEQRYLAKRVVHASHYGMGPQKFARVAGLPRLQAQALLNRYFSTYPRLKVWHLAVEDQLRRSRTLHTPLGWRRQFLGVWGDELLREAYAFVPQSTVADILNDGLIAYEQERPGETLLQIHDSLIVQVPPELVPRASEALQRCLTRPLQIDGQSCTIPVDVKVGDTWDSLH